MNLRNVRIGTRLGMAFGAILFLVACMSAAGQWFNSSSKQTLMAGMEVANQKMELATGMRSALLQGGIAMRNLGIHAEVSAMEKEAAIVKAQGERYGGLQKQLQALGLSVDEKKLVDTINRLDGELAAPFQEAMQHVQVFNGTAAGQIIAAKIDPLNQQALQAINRLVDLQRTAIQTVLANSVAADQRLSGLLLLSCVLALGIGVFFAWAITRSITRPLQEAVAVAQKVAAGELTSRLDIRGKDETSVLQRALQGMHDSLHRIVSDVRHGTESIATASAEIASGNLDLSTRTEEQASSLEETASSMEELTATVRQNAENAQQANQLVITASGVAVEGGRVVAQVVQTMDAIKHSSRKIADITSVIDGIAFQTNILALNAAVEAARAGEQGRGFAVVASEVRSLAQRSASAAREIKDLIDNSVSTVDSGEALVSQAGQTMAQIVTSVQRVADIMGEITAASQEQSSGIEQVNQAVGQMDQVTQQNAALVEEAAAAAESLQDQAAALARAVAIFRLEQDAGNHSTAIKQVAGLAPGARPDARRGAGTLAFTADTPVQRGSQPFPAATVVRAASNNAALETQ